MFELVVDDGKPFTYNLKTRGEVRKKLKELDKYYSKHEGEFAYIDINVYDGDKDITKEFPVGN